MSIIEREIAERKEMLEKHEVNVKLLAEARENVAQLEQLVNGFDASKLVAEIEELETYLPKPVEAEEKVDAEVVEGE